MQQYLEGLVSIVPVALKHIQLFGSRGSLSRQWLTQIQKRSMSQSSNTDRSADTNADSTDDGVCLEMSDVCLNVNTAHNTQ